MTDDLQVERERLLNDHFKEQWISADEFPACDEGLLLLRDFAEAHPAAYQLALQKGFVDLTHPGFGRMAKWLAYSQHRSSCEKCNEV
jgi:hypothetical protein